MDNLFIKEVINGKLVEIERVTVLVMLKVGLQTVKVPEEQKIVYLMCAITKVDGEYLKVDEPLQSTDLELFNFLSESLNAMTNNNIF